MSVFQVDIKNIIVDVEIIEDVLDFSIVEDHIDVEIYIYEDQIDIDIVEESVDVDILNETIEVIIDDCCFSSGGGGGDTTYHSYEYSHSDDTLASGDPVYMDSTQENFVLKALDNNSPLPIIGLVQRVISPTKVMVVVWGIYSLTNSFDAGKKLFVDSDGSLTNTLQQNHYIQSVGKAIDTNVIFIDPESIRVKRLSI